MAALIPCDELSGTLRLVPDLPGFAVWFLAGFRSQTGFLVPVC